VVQQQEQIEQARRFAEQWAAAELAGDAGALERILTPDFMAVGPRVFMLNRDEWRARHQSRDLVYSSFTLSDVAARLYGPAAVLIGRQTQEATYQGHPVPLSELRVTLVLARQDDGWRLAGVHLSPIVPN
jgi:uncharacterized protein (TIGR02246 family)